MEKARWLRRRAGSVSEGDVVVIDGEIAVVLLPGSLTSAGEDGDFVGDDLGAVALDVVLVGPARVVDRLIAAHNLAWSCRSIF